MLGKRSDNKNMSDYNEKQIRKYIKFYGVVQGVGFRYRAEHAANLIGATGWVRNDLDGGVSMEIQGTEEQIDQVLLMIEQGTYVEIRNMDVKRLKLVEGEYVFRTRR